MRRRHATARSRMCLAVRRSARLRPHFAAKDLGVLIALSDRDQYGEFGFMYRSSIITDLLDTFSDALWLQWGWGRGRADTWTAYGDPQNARFLPIAHLGQPWLVHDLPPDPSYLAPRLNWFHDKPRCHY